MAIEVGLCRRWAAVGVLAIALVAYPPRSPVVSAAVRTAVPHWSACEYAAGYQCTHVPVPLDYARPGGPTIEIAVIRHPATDPSRRLGSLVMNPGGPGGPGTLVLPLLYGRFPAEVRARYDIVSFDPRGVGRSDGLRCFPTEDAENAFLGPWADGFPDGTAQEAAWDQTYAAFDQRCAGDGGTILAHMSTADAARDMDAIRGALGEPRLNYYGISYGTILGATYANLFPGRVGNMVLDGNIDPAAWADGDGAVPTAIRMGADRASAATLRDFLRMCGSMPADGCAFSAGSPMATATRYMSLLNRLRRRAVTVASQTFTYAETVSRVDAFLDTTAAEPDIGQPGWRAGARLLEAIWTASGTASGTAPSPRAVAPESSGDAAHPYNGIEQELGVWCADSPNPADPAAYARTARVTARTSGAFGPMWAWRTEPCSSWPGGGRDRYTGPWNRDTAGPILVVGNTGDPATPYAGAVAMARDLAAGRLLTVAVDGHTALLNPTACATGYIARYLLAGALPAGETTCGPWADPFRAPATRR